MITRTLTISNKLGLHARAASLFVKTASSFGADIQVRNEVNTANGKSIMSVMMLQAAFGTEIELTVNGDDETLALDALTDLVNNKFGEAE